MFCYSLSLNVQTIVQSECIIRGDLANINVGRQCVIGKRAVITPPFKKLSHGCVCVCETSKARD